MSVFFLLVEMFLYGFAGWVFLKKREHALLYVPVLIFSYTVITPVIPIFVYFGVISVLIISVIVKNSLFFRNNFFAGLIFIYYLLLLSRSSHLGQMKWSLYFSVIWLFLAIPLIPEYFKKYTRSEIFDELSFSAFIVLAVFVANVLASTVFHYSLFAMYGITKGILYGNLFATDFNIVSIATFIVALGVIKKRNVLYLLVLVATVAFLVLSMRRSAMLISMFGVVVALFTLVDVKNLKKFIGGATLGCVIVAGLYFTTGIKSVFEERYDLRKLDERDLEEEKRFQEYDILYEDMVVHGKYSPWFGFEMFNSWGNYGNGIFETRSLHSDLASIAHSSGIIGVILYLLMILSAFVKAFKKSMTSLANKFSFFFCFIAFAMYTTTGRYTELGSMLFIFLVLYLPLTKPEHEYVLVEVEEEENEISTHPFLSPGRIADGRKIVFDN